MEKHLNISDWFWRVEGRTGVYSSNLEAYVDENDPAVLAFGRELDTISELDLALTLRRHSYPSIQDQLDMLYHDKINNTSTWTTAIGNVKTRFPKPQ